MTVMNTEQPDNCHELTSEDDFSLDSHDRMITLLVTIGMIASWSASVLVAMMIDANVEDAFADPLSKPVLYYILHATGIAAMCGAGFLAAVSGQYRRLDGFTRAAFWMMQAASIIWAILAYDLQDYLSLRAFGATGPLVWLSCILIFAGMNKSIWSRLDRVIKILSFLTASLALYAVAKYKLVDLRTESGPVLLMVILVWFAGWSLFTSTRDQRKGFLLRTFPFVAFIITAIFTQTRSWLLMSMLLLAAFFIIKAPSRATGDDTRFVRSKILVSFALVALMAGLLFQNELARSLDVLEERMYDDTRTGQYEEFFAQVPPSELIVGRGPTGTWYFGDRKYQYFDNAFLWMAFIGGVPILVSYLLLIVVPGVRVFFRGAGGNDAAAAALLMLWAVACLGLSTYTHPSLTPYSYFICLLAGRCHSYLAETADFEEDQG